VTEGGTYFPQLQICNNGSGHVGASLFGNSVTCATLSTKPYNKVTITDNTGAHTGLAILNNASDETGTMLRLLSATPTGKSYNFLTACAGTTAADKICNGTIVAELTSSGAFSVATSVTAPKFCLASNCITSWPSGGTSGVDYSRLTARLIEAAKKQQDEFLRQRAEMAKALDQIKRQQTLLREQTSAIRSLEAEIYETRETIRKVKEQLAASRLTAVAAK
jgi:hypothetical protein